MNDAIVFHPIEGAILDLESLTAIAAGPDRLLGAALRVLDMPALVIEGLELEGDWAPQGPPGTRRPEARSTEAVLTPGVALTQTEDGRTVVLRVTDPVRVPWPTAAGPAVRGVLVLTARTERARAPGGLTVAREELRPEIGFVRPEQAEAPGLVQLATPVGNGRDWITDVSRYYQPEHPAIEILLKRFDQLDQSVWRAEPEGSVWDRQVLGRNWVRYQTVAASALQATRILLSTQALTTRERVRLLTALFVQLNGSVQRAANELLQGIGRPDAAGPYAAVGKRSEEETG